MGIKQKTKERKVGMRMQWLEHEQPFWAIRQMFYVDAKNSRKARRKDPEILMILETPLLPFDCLSLNSVSVQFSHSVVSNCLRPHELLFLERYKSLTCLI